MRPLRQGRLKLALEELLSAQVEGPEALPSEPPASSLPEMQAQLGGQRFSTHPKHSSANLLGRNSGDRGQTGGIWPMVPGTSSHLRLASQVSPTMLQRLIDLTHALRPAIQVPTSCCQPSPNRLRAGYHCSR